MDSAVDPPILSCSDSPLSTTASIISILTFALGLLASYVALQSATRGAPSEIVRLIDDLRSTQHEINRVAEYIFDDAHNQFTAAHASFTRPVGITSPPVSINGQSSFANNVLYEEVQVLLGNCVRLFYEADDLLKRTKSEVDRWDPEGLRRRIIFVMNRHEMGEKMQRYVNLGALRPLFVVFYELRDILQEYGGCLCLILSG